MENTNESVSAGTYVFLLFLTLINIMNFVDRQLLASFANWIVPELGLTDTEFGLLTGLVFLFFYVVFDDVSDEVLAARDLLGRFYWFLLALAPRVDYFYFFGF